MEQKTASKRVEFIPPKDFAFPENADPDKDIDVVCSFRVKDGKLCMTKLGDTPMPGYDGKEEDDEHEEEPKHKPSYGDYSQGLMSGMGNPQPDDNY